MKYQITGVEVTYYGTTGLRFSGFRLKGVVGYVDPFVGAEMAHPLGEPGDDGDGWLKAELEWAQDQVGKYLVCDDLMFKAFATHGKTSIEEVI